MKTKSKNKKRNDSQLVELAGRNWLVSQLIRDGIEVARPERDHGVDLITYIEAPKFLACRVQIKVASKTSFSAYRKKYKGMLLVYVWHIDDPHQTVAFAMTQHEASRIAAKMNWTKKKNGSWKKKGYWTVSSVVPNGKLSTLLAPYRMDFGRWREIICMGARYETSSN